MEPSKVARQLSKLNNHYKRINAGGCGIIAYATYKALKRRGVRCEIAAVQTYQHGENAATNQIIEQVINGDSDKSYLPLNHVVIRFPDGSQVDTDGMNGEDTILEPISPNNMSRLLGFDTWNKTFLRANNRRSGYWLDDFNRLRSEIEAGIDMLLS